MATHHSPSATRNSRTNPPAATLPGDISTSASPRPPPVSPSPRALGSSRSHHHESYPSPVPCFAWASAEGSSSLDWQPPAIARIGSQFLRPCSQQYPTLEARAPRRRFLPAADRARSRPPRGSTAPSSRPDLSAGHTSLARLPPRPVSSQPPTAPFFTSYGLHVVHVLAPRRRFTVVNRTRTALLALRAETLDSCLLLAFMAAFGFSFVVSGSTVRTL